MALLFTDGFDHYGATRAQYKGWQSIGVRGSGRSLYGFPQGCISLNAPRTTAAGGMAYKTTSFGNWIIGFSPTGFYDGVELRHLSDGRLIVAAPLVGVGGGVQSDPSDHVLRLNQWYYVELQIQITLLTPTPLRFAIAYEARVNEETVLVGTLAPSSLTGGTVGYMNMISPGMRDDVYATDGELLGDVQVERLPAYADGDYLEWTPNGGAAHYDRVSELVEDEDVTYLDAGAAGLRETHRLPALDADEIKGIYHWFCIRGPAGANYAHAILRSGGADIEGDSQWTQAYYQCRGQGYRDNPFTGLAWTPGDLAGLQFGIVSE